MNKREYWQRAFRLASGAIIALMGLGIARTALAQYVVLAPPPAYYTAPPPPRMGYLWQPGYWAWQYGRYVWVPGHWVGRSARVVIAPRAPVSQVIRLSTDALFPFDRGGLADILPAGRADIREIASRLRGSHFQRIEVRGYTDRLGSDAYNLQLSERRANAVKALFVQDGIPAEKIAAIGLGKQNPIANCDDRQPHAALVNCLQPDRRVEIVTYAQPGRPE